MFSKAMMVGRSGGRTLANQRRRSDGDLRPSHPVTAMKVRVSRRGRPEPGESVAKRLSHDLDVARREIEVASKFEKMLYPFPCGLIALRGFVTIFGQNSPKHVPILSSDAPKMRLDGQALNNGREFR